ncbi:hypothetical protein [Methylacidiphilum caldifontis]|uniref:Uncharacterized protein n=1 Tax=Methylacidiphilum caldifontis TaxID=2795386 RepID=A0A4Y8PAE8_9BACT|nr:hypothetical protein [Methylacidiphilum caldifontis]TFE67524.1 hypothetical protein A7Q10_09475 [Methylacidiphilum caldifontis]
MKKFPWRIDNGGTRFSFPIIMDDRKKSEQKGILRLKIAQDRFFESLLKVNSSLTQDNTLLGGFFLGLILGILLGPLHRSFFKILDVGAAYLLWRHLLVLINISHNQDEG